MTDIELKQLGKTVVRVPALGLGTYGIGGGMASRFGGEQDEVSALKLGMELGMRFIDTAEIYGHGHSEEVVAKAIETDREAVFIATKVSAEHLTHDGVLRSCESSLRRLGTAYVDLYQVHWPNPRIPIKDTMRAMERLVNEGKIRHIGVSNFSVEQTKETQEALSRNQLASNQVEYSLMDRSIEGDLLPYCTRQKITVIAYSPVARGLIPKGGRGERWRVLDEIAVKYGKTRTQVALNWLIIKDCVVAIPKASRVEHVTENAGASGWRLDRQDREALDSVFV